MQPELSSRQHAGQKAGLNTGAFTQALKAKKKAPCEDKLDTKANTHAFGKAFDGECNGPEKKMYEGNGDNSGTDFQRALRCAAACQSRADSKEENTGFIVNANGRCFCEDSDSRSCRRIKNSFVRYDWGAPFLYFVLGRSLQWLQLRCLYLLMS